jgi:hypothetical protein
MSLLKFIGKKIKNNNQSALACLHPPRFVTALLSLLYQDEGKWLNISPHHDLTPETAPTLLLFAPLASYLRLMLLSVRTRFSAPIALRLAPLIAALPRDRGRLLDFASN